MSKYLNNSEVRQLVYGALGRLAHQQTNGDTTPNKVLDLGSEYKAFVDTEVYEHIITKLLEVVKKQNGFGSDLMMSLLLNVAHEDIVNAIQKVNLECHYAKILFSANTKTYQVTNGMVNVIFDELIRTYKDKETELRENLKRVIRTLNNFKLEKDSNMALTTNKETEIAAHVIVSTLRTYGGTGKNRRIRLNIGSDIIALSPIEHESFHGRFQKLIEDNNGTTNDSGLAILLNVVNQDIVDVITSECENGYFFEFDEESNTYTLSRDDSVHILETIMQQAFVPTDLRQLCQDTQTWFKQLIVTTVEFTEDVHKPLQKHLTDWIALDRDTDGRNPTWFLEQTIARMSDCLKEPLLSRKHFTPTVDIDVTIQIIKVGEHLVSLKIDDKGKFWIMSDTLDRFKNGFLCGQLNDNSDDIPYRLRYDAEFLRVAVIMNDGSENHIDVNPKGQLKGIRGVIGGMDEVAYFDKSEDTTSEPETLSKEDWVQASNHVKTLYQCCTENPDEIASDDEAKTLSILLKGDYTKVLLSDYVNVCRLLVHCGSGDYEGDTIESIPSQVENIYNANDMLIHIKKLEAKSLEFKSTLCNTSGTLTMDELEPILRDFDYVNNQHLIGEDEKETFENFLTEIFSSSSKNETVREMGGYNKTVLDCPMLLAGLEEALKNPIPQLVELELKYGTIGNIPLLEALNLLDRIEDNNKMENTAEELEKDTGDSNTVIMAGALAEFHREQTDLSETIAELSKQLPKQVLETLTANERDNIERCKLKLFVPLNIMYDTLDMLKRLVPSETDSAYAVIPKSIFESLQETHGRKVETTEGGMNLKSPYHGTHPLFDKFKENRLEDLKQELMDIIGKIGASEVFNNTNDGDLVLITNTQMGKDVEYADVLHVVNKLKAVLNKTMEPTAELGGLIVDDGTPPKDGNVLICVGLMINFINSNLTWEALEDTKDIKLKNIIELFSMDVITDVNVKEAIRLLNIVLNYDHA